MIMKNLSKTAFAKLQNRKPKVSSVDLIGRSERREARLWGKLEDLHKSSTRPTKDAKRRVLTSSAGKGPILDRVVTLLGAGCLPSVIRDVGFRSVAAPRFDWADAETKRIVFGAVAEVGAEPFQIAEVFGYETAPEIPSDPGMRREYEATLEAFAATISEREDLAEAEMLAEKEAKCNRIALARDLEDAKNITTQMKAGGHTEAFDPFAPILD